jgi:hypothetical protein
LNIRFFGFSPESPRPIATAFIGPARSIDAIQIAALPLVLGILLLTGNDTTSSDRLNLLGVILLASGALLVALARFLFSRNRSVGAGAVDPTAAR